ncbi:hypothetical protein EDD21DRAFT_90991 [Dissophora ornata]|nr:hypothetical protein EDD21DRAFT_90991 [Dissophora ornata]
MASNRTMAPPVMATQSVRTKKQTPVSPVSSHFHSCSSPSQTRAPSIADTTAASMDSPMRSDTAEAMMSQAELEWRMQALRASIVRRQQHHSAPQSRQQPLPAPKDNHQQETEQSESEISMDDHGHMGSEERASESTKSEVSEGAVAKRASRLTHQQPHHSGSGSASDSITEDYAPGFPDHYPIDSIRQELQSLRREMERSKFESQQLQHWIINRTDISRQQPHDETRMTSKHTTVKPGARHLRGVPKYEREQLYRQSQHKKVAFASNHGRHSSSGQFDSQAWTRTARHVRETKESSKSDTPHSGSDALRWSGRRAVMNRRREVDSSSESITSRSASAESEYRDPDKRVPAIFSGEVVATPHHTAMKRERKISSVCKRILIRITWLLFWILISVVMQVVVMGLLFRPNPSLSDFLATNYKGLPKTVPYRGRDYVADQVGFYTILDDGFGVDTLAYCHDLWEFPQDLRGHRHPFPLGLDRLLELMSQGSSLVSAAASKVSHTKPLQFVLSRWRTMREGGELY